MCGPSVGSADSKEAEHWQFLGGSRDGVRVLASGSGQAPEAGAGREIPDAALSKATFSTEA